MTKWVEVDLDWHSETLTVDRYADYWTPILSSKEHPIYDNIPLPDITLKGFLQTYSYYESQYIISGQSVTVTVNWQTAAVGPVLDALPTDVKGTTLESGGYTVAYTEPTTLHISKVMNTFDGETPFTVTLDALPYDHYYVLISSDLFTTESDIVNFKELTDAQKQAVGSADLYDAKGGDDVVTLPDTTAITGTSRSWDFTQSFSLGDGDDTVFGGKGNDKITGGTGSDSYYGIGVLSSDASLGVNVFDGSDYYNLNSQDQAIYGYEVARYRLHYGLSADSASWTATVAHDQDRDTLLNWKHLRFSDITVDESGLYERGLVALGSAAIKEAMDQVGAYVGKATSYFDYLPKDLSESLTKVAGWFNYAKLAIDSADAVLSAPDARTQAKTLTVLAVEQLTSPIIKEAADKLKAFFPDFNGTHDRIDKAAGDFNSLVTQTVLTTVDVATEATLKIDWNAIFNEIFNSLDAAVRSQWGNVEEFEFDALPQPDPTSPPDPPHPVHILLGSNVSGATVFADANENGLLDVGEPSAVPDSEGVYHLSGSPGPIIAFGGIDTSTGLAFDGQLSGPRGSNVVSPLTTLLVAGADQSKLLSGLGLSAGLDVRTFDPIAALRTNDLAGATVYVAGAKVMDVVIALGNAVTGFNGDEAKAQRDAFAALTQVFSHLGASETLDLSSAAVIHNLLTAVAQNQNIDLGNFGNTVAAVIAASDKLLDDALQSYGASDALLGHIIGEQKYIQSKQVFDTTISIAVHSVAENDIVNAALAAMGVPITGTTDAENGQTVTVKIVDGSNHVLKTFTTNVQNGTWLVNVSAGDADSLADGTYTVNADVNDLHGHSAPTAIRQFVKDTTSDADAMAAVTISDGDGFVNSSEVTTVGYSLSGVDADATATITFSDGTAAHDVVLSVLGNGAAKVSLSGLTDGPITASIAVTDAAGNTANGTGDSSVKDTIADPAPTASVTINDGDGLINASEVSSVGFTVAGLDADATAVVTFSDGSHSVTANVSANGNGTADLSSLNQGAVTASIAVTDTAGNTANGTGDSSVKDTIADAAPTASVTINDGDGFVNSSEVTTVGYTISGIDSDASATVTFSDGTNSIVLTNVGNGAHQVNLAGLNEGTVTATISVTDTAGNSAAGQGDTTVKDTVADAGAVPNVVLNDGDGYLNGAEASAVSFTVAGVDAGTTATVVFSDGNPLHDVTVTRGNGTGTVDLTGLTDGTITASIHVTDTAANTAAGTGDSSVKDTTADAAPAAALVINDGDGVISGAEKAALSYSVTGVDGDATGTVDFVDANNHHVTVTGVTNGTYAVDLSGLNAGSVTASLSVVDVAGNTANGAGDTSTIAVIGGTISGTSGDDVIDGTHTPNGQPFVSQNDDIVDAGAGNDIIHGLGGNDLLIGGAGDDTLFGDAGNDILRGGAGGDTMDGGAGNDTLDYSDSGAALQATLITHGVKGGDADGDNFTSFENITGTAFGDIIIGDNVTNVLLGNGGNDILDGLGSDDLLFGGDGGDALYGGSGNDQLLGGDGDDALFGNAGDDTAHGDRGDDVLVGQGGADTLYGEEGNDTLIGDDGIDTTTFGNDALFGEAGNDQMFGYAGDDTLDGGAGADFLSGGTGNDHLIGGEGGDNLQGEQGNDTLEGGAGDDALVGQIGDDTLDGDDGNDTLIGNEGNDILIGGAGNDQIFGYEDNDTLIGGTGDDFLAGGSGNDTLYANEGDDVLDGEDGNDALEGGAGGDNLNGGLGNDTVLGGDGNDGLLGWDGDDVLDGGTGNDFLVGDRFDGTGVRGNDTFVFRNGTGNDLIVDFQTTAAANGGSNHDVIDIRDFGFTNFQQVLDAATDVNGGVYLQLDSNDAIFIESSTPLAKAQLSATDFLLN